VENPCEVCGGAEDDINTLLCDDCDRPFHIYCLPRPMIAVPSGDWYCADCSDKRAVAARLQIRTGCELRCRDKAGKWQVGYMEAMGPEGVLVHYPAHAGAADEWVPLDSRRLRYEGAGFRTRVAEVDEEDDSACAVCGSAGDSEHLLLCDSEGCNAAYHTTCLRVPLAQVPEGDWHCERCDEQRAVHGTLERARALMPDGLRRWRRRVRGARSAAELALLLGTFEGALRLDELLPFYLDPPDNGAYGTGLYERVTLKAQITGLVDQHEPKRPLQELRRRPGGGPGEHRPEVAAALDDVAGHQPVLEEVEAELLGGAVGDVAGVGLPPFVEVHL
jgi:hypothetical protein